MHKSNRIKLHEQTRGLIFDLDGTLVDTMELHFEAWTITAKKFGFVYSREDFLKYAGMPTRNIISMLNKTHSLNVDVHSFGNERAAYFLSNIEKVKVIEHVFAIVKNYVGKLPIAIGTGSSRNIANLIIEKTGLKKYVTVLVTADDVTNHKPHPETFLKCALGINIEPKFCQVFEDAELGIEAAIKAGMIATNVNLCFL